MLLAQPDDAAALDRARVAASPRGDRHTPWPSVAIHGGVLLLWVALFARALAWDGPLAYSAGILYALYDTALLVFVAIQTRALRRPRAAAAALGHEPMAVIVAAYNEAAALPVTIASLLAQVPPPDLVIIADDGSDDATARVLATRFGLAPPPLGGLSAPVPAFPTLRWLRLPRGGKPRALNAALMHLSGGLVLTVDADTLLAPGSLAAMRRAFAQNARLVAATGVLLPTVPATAGVGARVLQRFQSYEYVRNFLSRFAWMRANGLLLISGAFAGFRTDAVRRVGGFDPDCLVEDYELIHRLRRFGTDHGLGWTTAVLGDAVATTDAPGTPAAFLRQRRRWFGGFLQTQLWYRAMVGNRRYGPLGLAMLPVKALDTLQPFYGLLAVCLLFGSILTGNVAVAGPAALVVGLKIAIDLGFHLWSVVLYRRWVGADTRTSPAGALLVALIEPFSFQILRHLGAALGWVTFLSGHRAWGRSSRAAPAVPTPTLPTPRPAFTFGGSMTGTTSEP